ncbi:MAG: hypothetical protein ACRELB_20860, partial [Polyangiaceae bacterium]
MRLVRALLRALPIALLAASLSTASCGSGAIANSGVAEPMLVSGAQFIGGDMPGTPPVDGAGGAPEGGADLPLSVAQVGYQNTSVVPGASGKSFNGLVST